jgi:hypothetical protein
MFGMMDNSYLTMFAGRSPRTPSFLPHGQNKFKHFILPARAFPFS